jgi:rare lipoprotein A
MNKMWRTFLLILFFLLVACGPRHVVIDRRTPPTEKKEAVQAKAEVKIEKRESKEVQYGVASWYGGEFHGRSTSSGEVYDMYQLTCGPRVLQSSISKKIMVDIITFGVFHKKVGR